MHPIPPDALTANGGAANAIQENEDNHPDKRKDISINKYGGENPLKPEELYDGDRDNDDVGEESRKPRVRQYLTSPRNVNNPVSTASSSKGERNEGNTPSVVGSDDGGGVATMTVDDHSSIVSSTHDGGGEGEGEEKGGESTAATVSGDNNKPAPDTSVPMDI
jgi:hypothetical protein